MSLLTLLQGNNGAGSLIWNLKSWPWPTAPTAPTTSPRFPSARRLSRWSRLTMAWTQFELLALPSNADVQVVAYQPPPGYALVPMAEVNSHYVVIISSIFVKLTFTFSASSYWGSHCTSFIWQGCCLNGKNLKNKKSCTALSEALIRYSDSHCSIHPNVQNGKLSHCVFSA